MTALTKKASRPRSVQSGPADHDPRPEAGQRRGLEARDRLPAEALVAHRGDRDEAEDGGDAGGGGGSLQPARGAQQPEVRGDPGQDDRRRPEGGPQLHDPVIPEAIGQRPEERGQDQLGGEERGREDGHGDRRDGLPAVLRQVREVVDEHRARQARAEAERERPDDDGPDGACHSVQGTRHRHRSAALECRAMESVRPLAPTPLARGGSGAVVAPASPGHGGRPRRSPGRRKRRGRGDRDECGPGRRDGPVLRPRR